MNSNNTVRNSRRITTHDTPPPEATANVNNSSTRARNGSVRQNAAVHSHNTNIHTNTVRNEPLNNSRLKNNNSRQNAAASGVRPSMRKNNNVNLSRTNSDRNNSSKEVFRSEGDDTKKQGNNNTARTYRNSHIPNSNANANANAKSSASSSIDSAYIKRPYPLNGKLNNNNTSTRSTPRLASDTPVVRNSNNSSIRGNSVSATHEDKGALGKNAASVALKKWWTSLWSKKEQQKRVETA